MIVEILGGPHDGLRIPVSDHATCVVLPLRTTKPVPLADDVRHADEFNLHEVVALVIEPQYNQRGDKRLIARWPGRQEKR